MLVSKRGDVGIGVLFLIVIIIFFFVWLVTYAQRECNDNGDCSKDSYCGSDFSCHKYPAIQQSIAGKSDYTLAAFLLGLSLVVSAIILRSRNNGTQAAPAMSHTPYHQTHEEGGHSLKSSQYFEPYGEDAPHQGGQKHH